MENYINQIDSQRYNLNYETDARNETQSFSNMTFGQENVAVEKEQTKPWSGRQMEQNEENHQNERRSSQIYVQ